MGTISDCLHLKVNLKKNTYLSLFVTLLPKIFKTFPTEEFFLFITGVNTTGAFKMALIGYSEAWGKLVHEKYLLSKISWHCPFKKFITF
jgi:hypothetical protein